MKKLIVVFVFAVLFSLNLSAQNEMQNLVKKGINETYSLNIPEAQKTFDKVISKFPQKAEGYLYKSQIGLILEAKMRLT